MAVLNFFKGLFSKCFDGIKVTLNFTLPTFSKKNEKQERIQEKKDA